MHGESLLSDFHEVAAGLVQVEWTNLTSFPTISLQGV